MQLNNNMRTAEIPNSCADQEVNYIRNDPMAYDMQDCLHLREQGGLAL